MIECQPSEKGGGGVSTTGGTVWEKDKMSAE